MNTLVEAKYSTAELMAAVMARHLRPGEVAIMGAVSALPQAACRLAQLTTAPGLWFIAGGSGAVNPHLRPLVASSCDERLLDADLVLPLNDVILLEGRGDVVDVFFAGGLQIDAHGNCNLGPVGHWTRPSLRGPGGVGLPFLARAGRVLIYSMSHDPRTLVEAVDFVSGPGFDGRPKQFPGGGPALLVTPLCTFDFDPATHRARLATLHPGVRLDQVVEATGFTFAMKEPLATTASPTSEELAILRGLDPDGLLGEFGR
ncbi:MAG TPA: CoA-transferase [Candidatus Dormibacteraeota bacterium]|nr:CoA-transferase [Candidatus Dormibacteraeota bacterium]